MGYFRLSTSLMSLPTNNEMTVRQRLGLGLGKPSRSTAGAERGRQPRLLSAPMQCDHITTRYVILKNVHHAQCFLSCYFGV